MRVCDDNETKWKGEKDVLYSPIKMCGGFLLMISMVSLFIYLFNFFKES